MLLTTLVFVAATASTSATPTSTVTAIGTKARPVRVADAYYDLKKANKAVDDGFNFLAMRGFGWGTHPDREVRNIKQARSELAAAQSKLKPKHRGDQNYAIVERNIAKLTKAIAVAELAHNCTTAYSAAFAALDDPKAYPVKLKAYIAAVDKLEKNNIKFFEPELKMYRERIAKVEAKFQQRMDKKNAAAADAQKKAEDEAKFKAFASIFALRAKARDTLEDADIEAFAKAAEGPELSEKQKRVFAYNLFHIRRDALLLDGATKSNANALAELVGGKAVASGTIKKKTISIKVKAKKDMCYVLLKQFRRPDGVKLVDEWNWKSSAKKPRPQQFAAWESRSNREPVASTMEVACALKNDSLKAQAKVDYPGNKNPFSYVVVELPRAKLPLEVTAQMSLSIVDRCDLDLAKSWFLRPIPGTLVYFEKEPALFRGGMGLFESQGKPMSVHRFRDLIRVNGERKSTRAQWAVKAPRRMTFKSTFKEWACPMWDQSAHAEKIHKCDDAVNRRYNKSYSRLSRKASAANNRGLINLTAEGEMSLIDAKVKRAYDKKCLPIEKRFLKKAERNMNDIVDELSESPPPPSYDRWSFIQDLAEVEQSRFQKPGKRR